MFDHSEKIQFALNPLVRHILRIIIIKTIYIVYISTWDTKNINYSFVRKLILYYSLNRFYVIIATSALWQK